VSRLAALLFLAAAAFGAEGGLAGAFLDYGAAPRSLAMGRAFSAVADDAEAGYFNPAGLFQLNSQEVILAHSQLYGARLEFIGYALPTRGTGTFGLTLINYGAEGLDSRTPENAEFRDYLFAENAYLASYAYNPWPLLGFGANLKLLTKNLAEYSDVGVGADVGALLLWPRPLSFGVTVQNLLQPSLTLSDVADIYPRSVRTGAAVRLLGGRAVIAVDAALPLLNEVDASTGYQTGRFVPRPALHGGVEFQIVPGVLIQRVGIDAQVISLGLGAHRSWGRMGIGGDYAVLLHHESKYLLPPTHKAGVFVSFSGFRVWIDAQPSLFSPTPEDKQNVLWMDIRLMTRAPTKRWQVLIKNHLGEVVRSYSGWDQPPLRMVWDGLDDAGRLVADGRYGYSIVVVDQRERALSFDGALTEVRTSGPEGKLEIRPTQ
jgi:hypothetical protein